LLQPREPRFVIAHLRAEQDVPNLINIAAALNNLRRSRSVFTLSDAALGLLGWVHLQFSSLFDGIRNPTSGACSWLAPSYGRGVRERQVRTRASSCGGVNGLLR